MKLPDVEWSALGAIGRSPAVRLTILVPILGYLLLLNADFLKLIQLVSTQSWAPPVSDNMSPPVKLIFTYLGLCSLGLASALFVWRCPTVPKQFASEEAYAAMISEHGDSGTDAGLVFDIAPEIERIWDHVDENELSKLRAEKGKLFAIMMRAAAIGQSMLKDAGLATYLSQELKESGSGARLFSALANLEEIGPESFDHVRGPAFQERKALAKLWFRLKDVERPTSRAATWWLFMFGFALVSAPTLWTVVEVLIAIAQMILHNVS